MVFLLFFIAVVVTVYVAMKISAYADVLSEKTALGGLLIGTLFLAGATSLPEVTTSVSAVMINSPDIAVGNVLGSNLFNLLILASLDLFFRKERALTCASRDHRYTVSLGFVLSMLVVLAMTLDLPYTLLGVGLDSLFLCTVYVSGMLLITKFSRHDSTLRHESTRPAVSAQEEVAVALDKEAARQDVPPQDTQALENKNISVQRAWLGFAVSAVLILVFGSLLTVTGDKIAVITGLGASFVGSFLIAASTSLPEAITAYAAFKLRNYNLAIGSILGSNLYNILILVGTDVIYRPGPLLSNVDTVHLLTAAFAGVLSLIVLYSLVRKNENSTVRYVIPSTLIIMVYFITSYLIFTGQ
ncbi:sodium/calcium exchanger membrane protein [Caldalkalibacillus thermarum]|uniref:sodium:calcium antiporter n=1 Tax=Caldalkalibacillus thermarum TaxID=296745 RepID=UPI00166AC656|nr:sodium:calcium antiporter [Caldalkalibacillus thermarum]GGK34572.1 sodium/calcium exchanger membrane protein [Caldalkalibacillus thermarum]